MSGFDTCITTSKHSYLQFPSTDTNMFKKHVHKTLTVFKNSILYLKYVRLNTCISSIQDLKARLIDTSIHHLDLTPALYSSRVMQMVAPIGHGLGDYNIWVLIFISHLKQE